MIEELHIFGIYVPAALAWAVLAGLMTSLGRPALQRLPLQRVIWSPALFELSVFAVLWWGLTRLGDTILPHWPAA